MALGVLILTTGLGLGWWYYTRMRDWNRPLRPGDYTVVIPPGSTAQKIAQLLAETGMVDDPARFVIAVEKAQALQKLKAGRYHFTGAQTPSEVVARLCQGPNAALRLTVPEGFTLHQIAQRAATSQLLDSTTAFLELCQDSQFIASLDLPVGNLEGYLFPATYFYDGRPSPERLITDMVSKFRRVAQDLDLFPQSWKIAGNPAGNTRTEAGLTPPEVVTLASLIEREAKVDEERPLMAGVFVNRLRKHISLGSSASLRYALDDWDSPETKLRVQYDSPFNTYKVKGLPPHPICNPGIPSLQAALHPAHTEWLYFTCVENNQHHFSKTLTEHNRFSRLYRRYHEARKLGDPNPERFLPTPSAQKQTPVPATALQAGASAVLAATKNISTTIKPLVKKKHKAGAS